MEIKKECKISCIFFCCSGLYGEISDEFIRKRIISNLNIINISKRDSSVQFYFKGKAYDIRRRENELWVMEWKFNRSGKKFQWNQFPVTENWSMEIFANMIKQKIPHSMFIGEKFFYCIAKQRKKSEPENQKSDDDVPTGIIDSNINIIGIGENVYPSIEERGMSIADIKGNALLPIDIKKCSDHSLMGVKRNSRKLPQGEESLYGKIASGVVNLWEAAKEYFSQ